jgi:hypothetical protein
MTETAWAVLKYASLRGRCTVGSFGVVRLVRLDEHACLGLAV